MHSMGDMELLEEYGSRGSEEAFATLVSRHINMVYSVALRHVGNLHNALEITQAVFIILAKKSRTLRRETIISGWLFQTAFPPTRWKRRRRDWHWPSLPRRSKGQP